jgi:hypothetical protein
MASTIVRLLPTIGAAIFSLLAFVFSLLTVTSKKWAVRHNYDPVLNPEDWRDPIYTLYRSPFTVCFAALVNASAAGSSGLTASDFDVNCTRFRPRGFNRTSCELAIATQDDTAITIGDNRLCQQIHYAGNYWIASTAFIGLAFLLTAVLAIFTFIKRPRFATEISGVAANGIQSPPRNDGQQYSQGNNNGGPSTTPVVVEKRQQGTIWVTWVAFVLLIFMFVGFATAVIGQYYGVGRKQRRREYPRQSRSMVPRGGVECLRDLFLGICNCRWRYRQSSMATSTVGGGTLMEKRRWR